MNTNLDNVSPYMRGVITRKADGKIEAPDNIITSLIGAQYQFTNLRSQSLSRIALYALIQGMNAGNPPYDQEELDANGLGHITNFNNFKLRSYTDRTAQMYWNLINATEVFARIGLSPEWPNGRQWASTIARNFNDVVREWPDFEVMMGLLGSQLTLFGFSPVLWPDEDNWQWEVVPVERFFIPDQTLSTSKNLNTVSIEVPYNLQQLYKFYLEAEKDEDSPWNKDALASYLIYRGNTFLKNINSPDTLTNPMDLQRMIQNNDNTTFSYFNDTVRIVHILQKEYDGKVSSYMMPREMWTNPTTSGEGDSTYDPDFLFFVDRQYDNMGEALAIFTASPGEWTIHSNMGVGQKVFSSTSAVNMLDCSILDMAKMASTPFLRTLMTVGREMSSIRVIPGVPTDIGSAEFVQNNFGSNINQLVGASEYTTRTIDVNAANGGDDPGLPDRAQGSISATQARNRTFQEFSILKTAVAHFYSTFDRVIRNMFIRMLEANEADAGYEFCREFKDRCIADGVPEELLENTDPSKITGLSKNYRFVKASRVAGDGSTLARLMGLESLGLITGSFTPEEMDSFKRELVEASMGVDYVDTFARPRSTSDETMGGRSLAQQENNGMKGGNPAEFDPANDQVAHATLHMQLLMETNQAVQQQLISPVDATRIYDLAIPHMIQHIQYMAASPMFYRDILAQIEKPFKEISQIAELTKRNAEQMLQAEIRRKQEEEAATNKTMSEIERKNALAAADIDRKNKDSDAKIARQDEASISKANDMRRKTEAKIETDRLKAAEQVAKKEATAKGRTELELEDRTETQVREELQDMLGDTPSNIDYE